MEKIFNQKITHALIEAEMDYLKRNELQKVRNSFEALWKYVEHNQIWYAE